MKKVLALVLSLALITTLAITGTVAYLKDTAEDVNVMTLGNVKIEQLEYERVVENGKWVSTNETDKYGYTPDELQEFAQNKPLYPAVFQDGDIKWDDRVNGHQQSWGQVSASGSNQLFDDSVKNAQDKFVFVKNTGKSDAYVRTLVAFEQGSIAAENFEKVIMTNRNASHWDWSNYMYNVEIDGNVYAVRSITYKGASSSGSNGILAPGAVSYPSLLQVYMKPEATNEDCEDIDGNGNGTYDILVLSQAVQTAGFNDAKTALDTAFGAFNESNVKTWFEGMEIPIVFSYEGVNYVYNSKKAEVFKASEEGTILYRGILSDGLTTVEEVVIKEGITRLNNRALCKAPTIKSVTLPSSLTYIDESAFQQSAITKIEVPENVTYIGKQAFGACGDLETIVINAKNVTIDNYVARACAKLKEVYINSDSVTFESGSMYFTTKENADASGITFYVKNQSMADTLYNAFSTSHSYGLLIKNIDGTVYYNTLKV